MERTFLSVLVFLGTITLAHAQSALLWESKTLELFPAASEKAVRADFGFTNRSKAPVVIDAVKSSCGCTTATLEKKVYQPGEKGHVTGVFTPGWGRGRGVVTKAISVKVKGEPKPTILMMVTHLGER